MEAAKRFEIAVEHLVREGHTDEQINALFVLTVTAVRKRLPKELGGLVVGLNANTQGTATASAGKRAVGALSVTKEPQGDHNE